MTKIIDYRASISNRDKIEQIIKRRKNSFDDIENQVADIIKSVRQRGDTALMEYAKKFDNCHIENSAQMKVSIAQRDELAAKCSSEFIEALQFAADRIRKHHLKMQPVDFSYTDDIGVELGWCFRAIESVGLYIPGGLTAYPSSVLMNAIPAIIAGVERLVLVSPAPNGNISPTICAAAKILQIEEIWKIGGAHSIAALCYGTQSIKPVDKIVGPGNAYVACAKKQVYGHCGIDLLAGPSEVLIIADSKAMPQEIAADLLAQAEHDVRAQSILMTDDEKLAQRVEKKVEMLLEKLPENRIARKSWHDNGAIIVIPAIDATCIELINKLAPEHLELQINQPEKIIPAIKHAGAIFIGRHTPEAFGDYTAGSNHVLPTSATARFCSGLSVDDFVKRISLISCSAKAAQKLQKNTIILANAEGLKAHAYSVKVRSKKNTKRTSSAK